ncbi:MAG: YbaK/EbsC family protein [Candidatus Rokubacteria bacterium]|nr:YbaK/EbsC family protein [Candidatus Rokubacteria bacterium]
MKPAAQKVQDVLVRLGIHRSLVELPVSAKTSQQAAAAVGVSVGQIAKSLVFTVNGSPILVVASGENRVDELKLERLAGGRIRKADPETVRQATGFSIGGVPPVGHATTLPVYIDRDLLRHPLIYAAGGVPECVFPLSPDELVRATGGRVVDVKVQPE